MTGPGGSLSDPILTEARELLLPLRDLTLDRFTIVGNYVRFDERVRGSLKDFRQRVVGTYEAHSLEPRNFLLWGPPGSGKSYVVQQISAQLPPTVQYRELNLAQLDEDGLRDGLAALAALASPVLCLVDEVDSKPNESWPFEVLLPHLEPPRARPAPTCFCLAGSGGRGLDELRERIGGRPKGADLLSRIPAGNSFAVPPLGVGDRIVVAAIQLLLAAGSEGRRVGEIEKLALYFIAVHPTYASARQLRSLAVQTAQRIHAGEDRIRFDDLFDAGDPENKRFWEHARADRAGLADAFVHVDPGTLFEGVVAAKTTALSAPDLVEPPRPDPGRILVLPFTNISPDPADEYFADGMTEELIEKLAHVDGLRVIARTTAMHYKGRRETALEIGRALRVRTVVECSVRKAGNRLRITAQLIETSSEEHLWAGHYDEELDDVFAIQDDIAGRIAASLAEHVPDRESSGRRPPAPPPPDTRDMEAYTSFLHGRKLFGEKDSERTVQQALAYFEEAVRRDPNFPRARVGVAGCVLWLGVEGALPYLESVRRAREELAQAIGQDEKLADAHSTLGGLLLAEDDVRGAEREARRAIALNPSLSDPYRWLAQIAAGDGRIDESVRLLETAYQIDPVESNVIAFLGRAYFYAGRATQARAHWERTEPLIPFRTNAHLTEYYLSRGDYGAAQATLRHMERLRPESLWTEMFRGFLAARTGDEPGARSSLARLEQRGERGQLTGFFAGFVHFALGEEDAFVASMEEALRSHALPLLELKYSPLLEAARSDPRIRELLRKQTDLRKGPDPPTREPSSVRPADVTGQK